MRSVTNGPFGLFRCPRTARWNVPATAANDEKEGNHVLTQPLAGPIDMVAGLPEGALEDKDLAIAFQRGEKGAYQAIHDRYASRVWGVCRRMLSNPHDAE